MLGVDRKALSYKFPHVFDYKKQGTLVLPRFKNSPKDGKSFCTELSMYLNNELSEEQNGVLVLFTSRNTMTEVFGQVRPQIRKLIRLQSSGKSPAILIEEHTQAINQGHVSIIFGLKSFFEGIDLKGFLCTKVVVTALPFLVPCEPIFQYRNYNLQLLNLNGFMHYSVPETALTLAQMAGRLIRTENDRGSLIICDNRVKKYQSLIRSIPPLQQVNVSAMPSAPPNTNQVKSEEIASQIIEIINAASGWISYAKIAFKIAQKHCFEPLVNGDKNTTVANLINKLVLSQGEFKRIKYRWSVKLVDKPVIKEFYCNFIANSEVNKADIDPEIIKSKLLPIIYSKEQYSYSDFEELGLQYLGVERG